MGIKCDYFQKYTIYIKPGNIIYKQNPSIQKKNVCVYQTTFNSLFKNLKFHCNFDLKAFHNRTNERIKKTMKRAYCYDYHPD